MQYGQEARDEDRRAATTVEVALRSRPVLLADPPAESGVLDMRAEPSPEGEADALTDQRPDDDGEREGEVLADAVEATSTMVSPGTIRPMSTDVSSMMPRPAMRVRAIGSTDWTVSRIQSRSSFTVRAYRGRGGGASD
jgi:hypothetical protein